MSDYKQIREKVLFTRGVPNGWIAYLRGKGTEGPHILGASPERKAGGWTAKQVAYHQALRALRKTEPASKTLQHIYD